MLNPKTMSDAGKVRILMENAQRQHRDDIVVACRIRLAELAGLPFEDALEREFWTAVTAAEEFKSAENGKTTRLSRTRQKYSRVGARKVIVDLASSPKTTEGFRVLIENGRPDLTFEGVVLRHQEKFDEETLKVARAKLLNAGIPLEEIELWQRNEA